MSIKSKLRGPFARVAVNLVIGVVGLVIVRLIAQSLPMFQDAGWIVAEKLTVLAGTLIVIDAMLLSVLVRFAIELRAYLAGRGLDDTTIARFRIGYAPDSGFFLRDALRREFDEDLHDTGNELADKEAL